MKNYAYEHRDELAKYNYVRIASPNTDYWVDFRVSKLNQYRKEFGDDFNLVIIGDKSVEGDFYMIPYRLVKEAFTEETLYRTPRQRWMASIVFHQLRIRRCPFTIDIGSYYGVPDSDVLNAGQVLSEDFADYAIQNRIMEINARQKQSLFRKKVLANFRHRCCLSNVREDNFLIASHIIPWSVRIETRLDPSNGLCLFYVYDKLFNDGYFSLNDDLRVVVTSQVSSLSSEIRDILTSIKAQKIRAPSNFPVSLSYISYHQKNVFMSR